MFGPFEARYRGDPIPRQAWGRQKSLAIAKFLLAHRGETVSVGRLAELFYDGAPVDRVLSNLRGRISEIRRALWPDRTHPDFEHGIQAIPPASYRFSRDASCWIDIEWFERYLESGTAYYRQELWRLALEDFGRASALYRGDFLADDLDHPWTADLRERLRLAYQSSLIHAAECHIHLGQYRQAAAAARRARELDPLDEEAYRLEIEAYGHIPDKAAALNVYEELALALRELSVEPDPEIKELVKRIKRGLLKADSPGPRHNLRQPLTSFFGREQELAALSEQLTDPQTRIVTLLGPGGIGKTRLAIEAGRRLVPAFRDGVFFVPVSEYPSTQGLATGIAQAIGFSVYRPESGIAELADYLLNKEMLLIIDAAESVGDATPIFDTLVRSSGIKLLITSRIRLHFPGEFIIDVEGLPYSVKAAGPDTKQQTPLPDRTPAYRLFVDRYARLRPRFQPTGEDREAICRICLLVEGMPLAIEMAASWGRVLTCREIAERITAFETLADALDDQSRGMQSVFSFSWQMLTEAERHAALRLSTFAGSFTRSAGEYVAGCPASTIMSLGDKSFLQWDSEGRFHIHEVIRGFLRRELASDPVAEVQALQVHAQYFARRLDSDPTQGISQKHVEELRHDLLNVQQAWRWWVSRMEVGTLQRTLRAVVHLHETADQWSAVVELLEDTIVSVQAKLKSPHAWDERVGGKEEVMALYAALLTHMGYVALRLGDVPRAQSALQEGKEILEAVRSEAQAAPAHTQALHRMISGWLSYERGDTAAAKVQLTTAAEELGALGDQWHRASAISLLATLARTSGDFDRSRELYEECLAIHQRLGDARAIAGALSNLGALYGNLQRYDEAEWHFNEARRYAEKGGHRLLQFFVIGNSGFLAYKRSRLDEAESLCREALDLAVDLGYKSGQAQIKYYLALIALERRKPAEALPYLRQALEQSLETQTLQLTLQVVHGYARYLALTGENEEAAVLLHFVTNQPAYPQAARVKSREVLTALASRITATQMAQAQREAAKRNLDEIVAALRQIGRH